MFYWLKQIIDRLFALAGALAFSQIPTFCEQYKIHLSGHLSELSYQISTFEKSAKLGGKTLQQMIEKFVNSSDPDFSSHGIFLKALLSRLDYLNGLMQSLEHASGLTRPLMLLKNFDLQLGRETLKHFQISFIFNIEGLVFSAIGLIVGFSLFRLLAIFFNLFAKRKRVENSS